MYSFEKTGLAAIEKFRRNYFNSLYAFQDIYLEFMVREGVCYLIRNEYKTAGYIIANNDNVLIEYYIEGEYYSQNSSILNLCIQKFNFNSILCKTFDHTLLDACLLNSFKYEVIGSLYRHIIQAPYFFTGELIVKPATDADLPFLLEQEDEVFEPKSSLPEMVKNQGIWLFYLNQKIIGCGFVTRIHAGWNYYDLGYQVHENYRCKGYARQILSFLKDYCMKNEFLPIAGCDINNIASRKVLEHNGFISNQKLLCFKV